MKDIVITKKRIFLEILFFIACLALAEGMNLYAIRKYETNYNEFWTQWLTVSVLGIIFYGLLAVIRIAFRIIVLFFKTIFKKTAH